MGGMVTWEREFLPQGRSRYSFLFQDPVSTQRGVILDANSTHVVTKPRQVTTSFRTGKGSPTEDDYVIPVSRSAAFRDWWLYNKDDERRRRGDTGHEFHTRKEYVEFYHMVNLTNTSKEVSYAGPLYSDARKHSSRMAQYPVLQEPDLSWYGPRAIDKTKPTNPLADMAQLLAELKREGLPFQPGSSLKNDVHSLIFGPAGEYLNVVFGWEPIVDTVKDIVSAFLNASKKLKQFERDSHRPVRRTYYFPPVVETRTLMDGTSGAVVNVPNVSSWYSLFPTTSSIQLKETLQTTTSVRFAGAYTYHVPIGDTFWSKMKSIEQKAHYLLGLRLTPELLWELAPWSWLGDWFGNIGDQISNLSSFSSDSLVLTYGYLTARTDAVRECTVKGVRWNDGKSIATLPPITTRYRTHRLDRVQSTPYGFGLNPNDFTVRQKAIIAALLGVKTQ